MTKYKNRDKFIELAKDMTDHPEQYGGKAREVLREGIIKNLDQMKYDDFHENSFDAPKMLMANHFSQLGRGDIADEVIQGEYDQ